MNNDGPIDLSAARKEALSKAMSLKKKAPEGEEKGPAKVPRPQPQPQHFGVTPASPQERAAYGEDVAGLVADIAAVQLGQDQSGMPVLMLIVPIPPVFAAMHRKVHLNPEGPLAEIAGGLRPGGKARLLIAKAALEKTYLEALEVLEAQLAAGPETPMGA